MFGVLRPPSPQERRPPPTDEAPPPPRSLAPMPSREFSTRENLLAGTKEWAAGQGYAIVIARSRANRLWLKCDRGGNYENRRNLTEEVRKRKRGESRLLGCPFRMIAVVKKDGTWKVETDTPEHNHGPSPDLTLHPTLRRMSEAQLAKVHQMFDSGKSPAETVDELKATWPDIKVLTRDVYNARKKYKTQKDEVDMVNGRAEGLVSDPNGVFPGPDENGRWAWVPDGEQVTSRKSKTRRKKATVAPPTVSLHGSAVDQTLDPQLQGAYQTYQSPQDAPTLPSLAALMNSSVPEESPAPYDLRNSAYQRKSHEASDLPHGMDGASNSPGPVRSPSQPVSLARTPVAAVVHSPIRDESSTADSPTVLAARIDRMEKEQQDQKNMLAQILGAVKGMSGNSPI